MKRTKEEMVKKHKQVTDLLEKVFEMYYRNSCQCAYPRYIQIVGVDCTISGDSFKSYDTELLIDYSRNYFNVLESCLTDERKNENWVCKKCGSIYEYGWSDFSIHVERQKLKLIELNTEQIGKPVNNPMPLYIGLMGHSYPPKSEIENVVFKQFANYMLEKES